MDQHIDQTGKLWAIIGYGGLLIGWPLAIVPLALRDDRYAMHHARQALGVWVGALVVGVVLGIVALLTCIGTLLVLPIAPFLALWPVVTALHGGWLVLHEDWAPPFGSFGLGDMMFGGIEVKDRGDAA